MQNPKRKDIFDAQPRETSKRHPLEPHSPWNNLNLILCIQDKHHGVLSHGLFHHMHIPEFLSLHVSENDDASWHQIVENIDGSRQPVPGKHCSSNNISADLQNSLFNFFVLIMEPLLLKINAYIQVEVDANPLLLDFHALLKSIGKLLASFMQDKVYVRTEDTSGGACLNFLKKIFNTLMTSFTSVLHFSNYDTTNRTEISSTLPANEILVAMGYLLQIEYEVIVTWCNSRYDCLAKGRGMMFWVRGNFFKIVILFVLIQLVLFLVFLSNEFHSEAVERLLSSEKFINAIYKAVESIPEGQVCGCIRQITEDISESLRWMKDFCPLVDGKKLQNFNLQGELLGRGLSRLYCLVLGSVIITNSNHNLLGVAVNELMALVRPYLSILVGQQPDTICKFFSSVIGETVDQVVRKGKVLKKFGRSSQWVLVFFFQLFVSCQSLYRQASLRPPDLPKMSAEVEDYTTYSASELMERIDKIDFGYFSWIVQPSSSLLVVMQFISDIYLKLGSDDSSPLIYIFQSMALRRLVYLNKQIKLFKYLKKKHYLQKKSYRSQIKTLKEEAADLTNFILEYLSCVYQSPIFVSDYVTCEDVVSVVTQSIQDHIKERCNQWDWDLGVYAANKKSLPTLIWSKLCKNVDIWSNHASKKQLKTFFSHLLHAYLHSVTSSFQEPGVQEIDKCKLLKTITLSQISSELLNDSLFYEQKFAHRSLASIFCLALEKLVLPLFSNIPFFKFLSSTTPSCDKLPADISRKDETFPVTDKIFRDCHQLLDLLCRMQDKNARSFSHLLTCIFNLERLLIGALLYFQSTMHWDYYFEYLRLFVSCRKTLWHILVGFYDKANTIPFSPNSIISGSSLPVLWLSKSLSVVVGIKESHSTKNIILCKSMMFSLMHYTSNVLFGIGKYQIVHAFSISKEAVMPCEEISNHKISHEENHLLPYSQDSPKLEALKCLTFMAENLRKQIQSLLVSVHNTPCNVNVGFGLTYENINRLSSSACCFSRLLWGLLTSSTDQTDAKDSDEKEKVLMWKSEHASELDSCISSLMELTNVFCKQIAYRE
ncbi:hypothetical protein D0Y65_021380 [Glycine soja]|uniref:Uncharacterized protein n=1 Tax=Glycine soja TaxID=3848 RepID=A0A445JIZ7_GLYSO|nr:hypothetical protein D0Y65_021380 [Glycine soja]